MERWRLLVTWDGEPGYNMALDEALLVGSADPTLRLYTWKPEALSLGYFQRAGDVPGIAKSEAVVRRLTGGGAIHHADELTFSIAAPVDHALYAGEIRGSYERVHGAIRVALATFGVDATLRGDRGLTSDRTDTGMCFEHSTDLDLAWSGAKGVGSAQRRTGGRVLHHGSIKLGRSSLDRSVAALRDVAPSVDVETLGARLVESFADRFDASFETETASPEEEAHARERAAHFTSEAFVYRR